MGKRRTIQSASIRIALVAMAFQGLTPDTHALSSSLLFELLNPSRVHGKASGIRFVVGGRVVLGVEVPHSAAGSIPRDLKEQDPPSGEVCVPVRSSVGRLLDRHAVDPQRLPHLTTDPCGRPAQPVHLASTHRARTAAAGGTLILALCRLTC